MGGRRALFLYACGLAAGSSPASGAAQTAAPVAGAVRAPESFFIQAFDVSGVTRLPTAEVERLVYPFSGPGRTAADVEKARKALQDDYAARGFGAVVVEVPTQPRDSFTQGIVQITVAEAPLGELRVTDSRYHALWVARGQVPSLAEGQPVNLKALQREVSAANLFPDRTIEPQFKPGRATGTIDVDLKVTDQLPLHASVELDNDNSPSTSPLRLTASARYTNLFQTGQALTFSYTVAPENRADAEVFFGSYQIPLLHSPWSFTISGYHSNSNVSSLGGSSVLGRGYQVGVRAIYHISPSGPAQTISFGPDFKDFQQRILVGGTTASSSPLRYIPVELTYALAGATEHSSYAISLGATAGLRAIKQVVCADPTGNCVLVDAFGHHESTAGTHENFVRGDLTVDYSYAFASDMIAAFRLSGQLADSHLITNEQFAAGGLFSVRGYYATEAVGDDGIAPSLELRSPSLAPNFAKWLTEARLFGFVDSAFVRVLDPSVGGTASYALVSIGGGLRARVLDKLSGEVLAGLPLTDGSVTKGGHPRVSFQVKGEF